jgi:hypothetical protein
MGLNPLAAGFAALLILAPAESGDFGGYGLSSGAYLWRGTGLYAELFSLLLLLPAFGLAARAVNSGTGYTGAALALALTALSHIIFGYVAFLSIAIWALAGPDEGRARRLARAASISGRAMLLLAWFVIPMMLVGGEINRSRWEATYKFDSYGAPFILRELFSGRLLDFGRLPVLSLMVALGALIAAFNFKDSLARRLLVLTAVWLGLFFGRETWGHLLVLAGIPAGFPLHRLEGAFELFAMLLAGWGLERAIAAAMRAPALVTIAVGAVLGAAILLLALDRAEYLRLNALWGEANLTAFQRERGDLEAALADVRTMLAERPGRVSAGKAADWGWPFKIGEAHGFSFLSTGGFDETSFLYHAMSLSSDYMVLRDENDPVHQQLFGIRAVLAPTGLKVPAYFRRHSVHGPYAVYETSPEGYFGLVDIAARYDGPAAKWLDPVSGWLFSALPRVGQVIALDPYLKGVPAIARWDPMPAPSTRYMTPRGRILSESKVRENYRASIDAQRACYALIKITYFPGLVARVDGRRAPLIRVSPDFGAIPLTPGHHEVEVRYQPGPLKPLLFLAGIVLFVLAARPSLGASWERGERWLEGRLELCGGWLSTDRIKIALSLALLVLLFTRGLFRGRLIDGHDAPCYPPRLTEFAKIVADHQFPPLWAPDLSNGHGQPLFEFSPPLTYLAALPFFKCGLSTADSLQFGLVVLFAIGALAVYLLGRKLSFPPVASLGAAAAWLFAPYQALDLYVRAALAEAAAVAIAPLALLGLMTALDRPTVMTVTLSAAAIALVPLAHNAVALFMFPVFAAIVLARSAISRRPLKTAVAGGLAIAGGLGLSAFLWVPALLEKDYVKLELLLQGLLNWRAHIISPIQLLWGRWGFGYSVVGPNDGISFSLGLIHIALAVAGAVIGIRALNRTRRLDALVFAGAAIAGALMATEWSSPIWARVPMLHYLQFPWRTLFLPALFIPLLALYLFEGIGSKAGVAVIVLLVLVNLHHTQPKGYLTYDEEFYLPASLAQRGLNTSTREEYEPRWVQVRLHYTGDGIPLPTPLTAVRTLSWTPTRHVYSVSSPGLVRVMDSTDYYPGWVVSIDGADTTVSPTPLYGTISFQVPPGRHTIAIEMRPTRVRRVGFLLSLVSLALMLLVATVTFVYRAFENTFPPAEEQHADSHSSAPSERSPVTQQAATPADPEDQ